MSFFIYHVQIGDGSIYQQQETPLPDTDDIAKWKQAYRDSRMCAHAGATGYAVCTVMWHDGQLYARLMVASGGREEDENEQPNIILCMDIHEWEAMVACVSSKRKELELRTFHDHDDKTEEV